MSMRFLKKITKSLPQTWKKLLKSNAALRVALFSAFVVLAAILGACSFIWLKAKEEDLYEHQVVRTVKHADEFAPLEIQRKVYGAEMLAEVMGGAFPSSSPWPYASISQFSAISTKATAAVDARRIAFAPIVLPSQVLAFEQFAYSWFNTSSSEVRDEDVLHEFGTGIYKLSRSSGYSDGREHDTTGITDYDSPNQILTPIFQTSSGNDELTFNVHSERARGRAMDRVIACVTEANARNAPVAELKSCSAISSILPMSASFPAEDSWDGSPLSTIVQPVFPSQNASNLVGFMLVTFSWSDLLSAVVPQDVSHMRAVLIPSPSLSPSTAADGDDDDDLSTMQYTFDLETGESVCLGGSKAPSHLDGGAHVTLSVPFIPADNLFGRRAESPDYAIRMYATPKLRDSYSSEDPTVACVAAVALVGFLALLVAVYDMHILRELAACHAVIENKRKFMRFVSHEVRTPLNTVCLGLKLLSTYIGDLAKPGAMNPLSSFCGLDSSLDRFPPQKLGRVAETDTEDDAAEQFGDPYNERALSVGDVNELSIESCRSTSTIPFASFLVTGVREKCEEWCSLCDDLLENANSAVLVLNDFLNFDKIESGTLVLEICDVDVSSLMRRTVGGFSVQAQQKGVRMELTGLLEDAWVAASGAAARAGSSDISVKELTRNSAKAITAMLKSGGKNSGSSRGFVNLLSSKGAREHRGIEEAGEAHVPGRDEEMGLGAMHKQADGAAEGERLGEQEQLCEQEVGEDEEQEQGKPEGVEVLRVVGDDLRLVQVLRNLISNALKFTPTGGKISIVAEWVERGLPSAKLPSVATSEDGSAAPMRVRAGSVCIRVTDSGAGLSEEQLGKICGEGVQFNANKLQAGQGSGFGLNIARGIVEQHAGTLTVTSPGLGKGTTFTVELPLVRVVLLPEREEAEEGDEGGEENAREGQQALAREQKDSDSTGQIEDSLRTDCGGAFSNSSSSISFLLHAGAARVDPGITLRDSLTDSINAAICATNSSAGPALGSISGHTENMFHRRQQGVGVGAGPAGKRVGLAREGATNTGQKVHKKRILVVDDAAMSRKMLVRLLAREGHVCEQAEDGLDCIEKYLAARLDPRATSFDTILMDSEMPRMDGPSATQRLRSEHGCDCLIVGVTGNVLDDDVSHFLAQGADCVLPKPLEMKSLQDLWNTRAEEVLQRQHAKPQRRRSSVTRVVQGMRFHQPVVPLAMPDPSSPAHKSAVIKRGPADRGNGFVVVDAVNGAVRAGSASAAEMEEGQAGVAIR